jgi:hypothetical protein
MTIRTHVKLQRITISTSDCDRESAQGCIDPMRERRRTLKQVIESVRL